MLSIFPIQFVANCSAVVWILWNIGQAGKEKALHHHKQESSKKGFVGKLTIKSRDW